MSQILHCTVDMSPYYRYFEATPWHCTIYTVNILKKFTRKIKLNVRNLIAQVSFSTKLKSFVYKNVGSNITLDIELILKFIVIILNFYIHIFTYD